MNNFEFKQVKLNNSDINSIVVITHINNKINFIFYTPETTMHRVVFLRNWTFKSKKIRSVPAELNIFTKWFNIYCRKQWPNNALDTWKTWFNV